MKKTLLLFAMLLGVVGAWAQEAETPKTVVKFRNVQKNGTKYSLYINGDGTLNVSSTEEPTEFVMQLRENGKFSFYNEEKKLYLIWRGNDSGHNNNKGVMSEYNSTYCDWTFLNAPKEGLYLFYSKRSGGTSDGSIVITSGGDFNKYGASYGYTDTYSNLYEIEGLPTLEYTLTDDNGNIYQGTHTGLPGCWNGLNVTNQTWTNNQFSANISFPFPVSSAEQVNPTFIVSGANWTNNNSRKWRAVKEGGVDYVKMSTSAVTLSDVNSLWAIYPTFRNNDFCYTIKNISTDKYILASLSATGVTNDVTGANKCVTLVEGSANGTYFTYNLRVKEDGLNKYQFSYVNAADAILKLSISSSGTSHSQYLGVYSGSHKGDDTAFPAFLEEMDFSSLPFKVSDQSTSTSMMISSFKEGHTGDQGDFQYGFKWYSSGDGVRIKRMHSATVADLDNFSWAIYPMPVASEMCYAIKNVKTGKYIYTTAFYQNNGGHGEDGTDVVTLSETPMYFKLNSSNGAFYYVPAGSSTNHYLSCNTTTSVNEQRLGVWTSNHKGTTNEFLPLSFKVEVSDLDYSTLYSPISVKQTDYKGIESSDLVKVYSIESPSEGNWVTLTEKEGGIPANEGAILKNEGTVYFTQSADVDADSWASNLLQGSSVDTYVAGEAYVLSAPNNNVGLYKAELNKNANGESGDTHFKNNAGKAYLPAPAGSEARFLVFSFGDDMETGITETENGNVKTENTVVYDLAGRRVQGAQKGIFIVNGKKVVR